VIYLDHNASTPLVKEALAALNRALVEGFGNPSSSHSFGKRARAFVDEARAQVAHLIGAHDDEIVFTSGGTESSNLAIRGALATAAVGRNRVVTSSLEHPATAATLTTLTPLTTLTGAHAPLKVVKLAVNDRGESCVDAIDASVALVTIIHAQNETGVIQPVAALAKLAKQYGALVHADGAQSVGKMRVNVDELGVDLLSIAGHKLGAPKGVGALYIRRGTRIEPVLRGASHERGLRPGTENVASIAALGAACEVASRTLADESARQRALRDRLEAKLREAIPGLAVNGEKAERLPNTASVRFPGVVGRALLERCETVAASTGSACHDGHDEAPQAIVAMGVSERDALGTVRLSLGRTTTEDDVDHAARALISAWTRCSTAS
jgi:cysteine desulfurase